MSVREPGKPSISRRAFHASILTGGAAVVLERLLGCSLPEPSAGKAPGKSAAPLTDATAASTSASPMASKDAPRGSLMPVGFVGHGSPMNALEQEGTPAAWRAWSRAIPRPSAVLVVSAHWQESPPVVGARETLPLVYDFYGFPKELYEVRYSAPGAPALASETKGLLEKAGLSPGNDPTRGLDHGAWVPLVQMFPEADVPVLQVSLGYRVANSEHLALGRALAPLRKAGVFILGSGNLTHNLRMANFEEPNAAPDAWAKEFDAWCVETIERGDLDALADYAQKAPGARLAVPTDEHFTPLLVAAAAAFEAGKARVRYPHQGIEHQNLSMRCFELA